MGVRAKSLVELDIAVLCGGPGAEREVSLESGAAVALGLREAGLSARQVEVTGAAAEVKALSCDIAFVALHGEFGEDGAVQQLLEEKGMPYTGSRSAACALSLNKDAAKRRFLAAGIATPRWAVFHDTIAAVRLAAAPEFALPVIVKPVNRGSSVGTTIVREAAELEGAAELALSLAETAMLEEFVSGRELTVGLLEGQALPVVELKPAREFYDYQAKYQDENTRYLCPAPLNQAETSELQNLGLLVNAALGTEHFGRVDIMLGAAGPRVLELNSIPGFTAHSLLPLAAGAAGIDFPELCRRILEQGWRRGA